MTVLGHGIEKSKVKLYYFLLSNPYILHKKILVEQGKECPLVYPLLSVISYISLHLK
jgi:hypothetical protein